ncbi:ribbon-helix-helix domain-containing protein [Laspinema palackyanum]|uniref:ribbon-helix-helix domain-containing protein n=1 Tax=Laspinema palackyanum TaxID=3231601 RepID=UPI00345D2CA6|nr:hypothetical protein [Laspinema sp. D2c]
MSKRIQVILSDRAAADLEEWAHSEGRSVSNLSAYLLERAIEEARHQGRLKNYPKNPPQSSSEQ